MSIIDAINLNTAAVTNAKMSLQDAINAKGGGVPVTDNFPTFRELLDGVDNILAIDDVGGVEDVTVLATQDLVKGDTCVLVPPTTGVTAVGEATAPINYKYTHTTGILSSTLATDESEVFAVGQGKFLKIAYSTAASSGYKKTWIFLRVGNTYQQLKVEGDYDNFEYTKMYKYPTAFYDESTDRLFNIDTNGYLKVYQIDYANLNLVLVHKINLRSKFYLLLWYMGAQQ